MGKIMLTKLAANAPRGVCSELYSSKASCQKSYIIKLVAKHFVVCVE